MLRDVSPPRSAELLSATLQRAQLAMAVYELERLNRTRMLPPTSKHDAIDSMFDRDEHRVRWRTPRRSKTRPAPSRARVLSRGPWRSIRAAGESSFKGYGRAAAAMIALDAARLFIAAAGSTFAKDSLDVLKGFAKLKPITVRTRLTSPLEDVLAAVTAASLFSVLTEIALREERKSTTSLSDTQGGISFR